jgi:hypothetical protein
MAEIATTLFFRNNRQYRVGSIVLDLLLSEGHNFSSEITQFNIEDGSEITDHIRKMLFQGTLTAKVTNFSLFQFGITSNRAQEAYDKLKEIWERGELVDIVTVYDVFENVGISNISTARDFSTGEAIEFNISFQEVNIVQLQEILIVANVKLLDMVSDTNKQASPKLDVGKQQNVLGGFR